jgi:hypothetical protein
MEQSAMEPSTRQFDRKHWIVGILMLGMTVISSHAASPVSKRILPPNSSPYGHSYGEWGAMWWQWALSIAVGDSPLFDESGENANIGQSGPVYFLAGSFTSNDVTRTISVPAGKALFFPLLNVFNDNECVDPPLTVEELYAGAEGFMDLTTELHAIIDGVEVRSLFSYRAASPAPYAVELPAVDNIYQLFGCDVSGTVYPQVTDGYWLMLAPLTVGEHTINFGGTIGDPVNFTLDITYHITVTP